MKKYILTESQIRNLVNNVVDEGGGGWNKGETKYTPEYLEKIKEKYKGRPITDFRHGEDRLVYKYVKDKLSREDLFDFYKDMVSGDMVSGRKFRTNWDNENIDDIIKQYDGVDYKTFRKEQPNLYNYIINKGKDFIDEKTKNMVKMQRYTDDELRQEALKYKTKKEFSLGSPQHYNAAKERHYKENPVTGKWRGTRDFYDDITSHMVPYGNNLSKRMIYVHEFYSEKGKRVAAYVGLTHNQEKRYKEHMTGKFGEKKQTTPVTRFMIENPTLKHVYKQLTDYIDALDAVKEELKWEKLYKSKGWLLLNVAKAGSLGGVSTGNFTIDNKDIKDIVKMALHKGMGLKEFRETYPAVFSAIYRRNLHKEPYNYLDYFTRVTTIPVDEIIKRAKKYKSLTDIRTNDGKLYGLIVSRKLLDVIKSLFDYPSNTRRSESQLIDMAKKYNSLEELRLNDELLLKRIKNKGLLDKIKEIYGEPRDRYIKKTDEQLLDDSKKYNSFKELMKDQSFYSKLWKRGLIDKVREMFK